MVGNHDIELFTNLVLEPDPASKDIHLMFYHLCKFMQAKVTVEIGIGRGFCAYVLGKHAQEIGGRHYEIDIDHTPINRAKKVRDEFGLPIEIIHADSKTINWTIPIDLLFIDGGHKYEQVIGDIETYVPYVKKGRGLIFFDDYYLKRTDVNRAVDERFDPDKYEQMHWPYSSPGMVIWRVL